MSLRSRNKNLEYSLDDNGEAKPTHLVISSAKDKSKTRNGMHLSSYVV